MVDVMTGWMSTVFYGRSQAFERQLWISLAIFVGLMLAQPPPCWMRQAAVDVFLGVVFQRGGRSGHNPVAAAGCRR